MGGLRQTQGPHAPTPRSHRCPSPTPPWADYEFLAVLYEDHYFPNHVLTHAATHEFNALEAEFEEAGSEIETVRPTPRPALPRRHVSITGVSSAT